MIHSVSVSMFGCAVLMSLQYRCWTLCWTALFKAKALSILHPDWSLKRKKQSPLSSPSTVIHLSHHTNISGTKFCPFPINLGPKQTRQKKKWKKKKMEGCKNLPWMKWGSWCCFVFFFFFLGIQMTWLSNLHPDINGKNKNKAVGFISQKIIQC